MNKETYRQNVVETSVSIVQSAVQAVRTKNITKTALRLYDGTSIGVAGALGAVDDADIERRATDALGRGIPYPFEPLTAPAEKRRVPGSIDDPNEFVEEIDALTASLREQNPDFIFSNKANLATVTVTLSNDRGLDYSYTASTVEIELFMKEKSSVDLIDTGIGYSGPDYDREKLLAMARQTSDGYRNPVALEPGPMPVCFLADDVTYQTKLLQELHGLQYGSGGSIFAGKIGEKLFSDRVTIYQSRAAGDDVYRPFFDFEGTTNPDDRYYLVRDGVLKAAYTNRNYAAKYDLPLTGAAGGDYDSVPDLAAPTLRLTKSEKTAAELLDGRMGLLVFIAFGGDFTPDGTYASPVQNAYLFDGEKIVGRAPEVSISSHLYKMFGDDFIGVSSDSVLPMEPSHVFIATMKVAT